MRSITGRNLRKKLTVRSRTRRSQKPSEIARPELTPELEKEVRKDLDKLMQRGARECAKTGFDSWSTQINFDPEFAVYLLERCKFLRQRKLRTSLIEQMVRDMSNDDWRAGSEIIVGVRKDGDELTPYLINGQHRSHAVIKSGCSVEMTIVFIYREDMGQIEQDYAVIDSTGGRNMADRNKALDIHGKLDMNITEVNKISNAVVYIIGAFDKTWVKSARRAHNLRTRATIDYSDEGRKVLDVIKGSDASISQKLQRAPILAVAMITMSYQPKKSEKFWNIVAHAGEKSSHPAMKLRELLLQDSGQRGPRYRRKDFSPHEWARIAANCWTNFMKNKSVKSSPYLKSSDSPMLLYGCKNYANRTVFHLPYGEFFEDDWMEPTAVTK